MADAEKWVPGVLPKMLGYYSFRRRLIETTAYLCDARYRCDVCNEIHTDPCFYREAEKLDWGSFMPQGRLRDG